MTEAQRELLERRREAYEEVMSQLEPSLVELADHLGMPRPRAVMSRLGELLTTLDETLPRLDIDALDTPQMVWLNTRMLYFVGAWLCERFGAHWILQEDPDSDFFMRYVIGGFEVGDDPHLMIDPLELAMFVLEAPETRCLSEVLEGVVS